MIRRDHLYIDGAWREPDRAERIEVYSPVTGQLLGLIPAGTATDVDAAVAAARGAFRGWADTSVHERVAALHRIADGLERRRDDLLDLIVAEVGTPRAQALTTQVGIAVHTFRDAADSVAPLLDVEEIGNSKIHREPVGVVGAITPWNFPLYQLALKVAPAIAAGCTTVVKPSEIAGLSPFVLTEIIDECGLPPGVFNLVSGRGSEAGEALVAHPSVDMISFTGSDRAGRHIAATAARTVKKVTLELGGKSAIVILDDADLEAAVGAGVASCFANNGQVCAAFSRMIVPRSRLADVESAAVSAASRYQPGNPADDGPVLGPVVSPSQRQRAAQFIESAIADGAKLLLGGSEVPPGATSECFVAPTLFSDVDPQSRLAQEEVFAPVLAIIPVDDDQEAVSVANGTRYGLNAAVWSADVSRAERVGALLDASTVYINGGKFNPSAPFGGTKQSGYGRERGRFGIEEYLRTKSYQY